MDKGLVLVVEDEAATRALLAALLARSGYETHACASGEECLEALRTVNPDAIVLDLLMPGLSGVEVLERLREASESRRVPVVVVSAQPEARAGALLDRFEHTSFLPKPFRIEGFADDFARRLAEAAAGTADAGDMAGRFADSAAWCFAAAQSAGGKDERLWLRAGWWFERLARDLAEPSPVPDERRRHPRVPLRDGCFVVWNGRAFAAKLQDISTGGCALVGPADLMPAEGDRCEVTSPGRFWCRPAAIVGVEAETEGSRCRLRFLDCH
ncbi:MAG TPA: response regulator [Azospirillaceae bacterium]|nr:response regulator [Azospirillaceae bacterium]